MNWEIQTHRLRTPTGKTVIFDFDIKQVAEVGDVLVVLLDVPPDRVMTENVFGVSREGKLLWQIERIAETATDPVNVYTAIGTPESGAIHLFNWNCTDVTVDIFDGKVLNTRIVK